MTTFWRIKFVKVTFRQKQNSPSINHRIFYFQLLWSCVIISLATSVLGDGLGSGMDKEDEEVPPAAKDGQDKLHSRPSDPVEGEKSFSEVILPHPSRNCTDRIEINLKMYLHNVKVIWIFPQIIHSHHKELIAKLHVRFPPLFFRIMLSIKKF